MRSFVRSVGVIVLDEENIKMPERRKLDKQSWCLKITITNVRDRPRLKTVRYTGGVTERKESQLRPECESGTETHNFSAHCKKKSRAGSLEVSLFRFIC
jgi:hypothetical protein